MKVLKTLGDWLGDVWAALDELSPIFIAVTLSAAGLVVLALAVTR